MFGVAALPSATIEGFEPLPVVGAVLAAGVLVDVLAAVLRPSATRRAAYWAFGALAPLLTWALVLLATAVTVGGLSVERRPAVLEFWTGLPVVAGLLGSALAALMLPAVTDRSTT